MAYREHGMWEILEVLKKLHEGKSVRVTSRLTGRDRKTVARYLAAAAGHYCRPETRATPYHCSLLSPRDPSNSLSLLTSQRIHDSHISPQIWIFKPAVEGIFTEQIDDRHMFCSSNCEVLKALRGSKCNGAPRLHESRRTTGDCIILFPRSDAVRDPLNEPFPMTSGRVGRRPGRGCVYDEFTRNVAPSYVVITHLGGLNVPTGNSRS